MNNDKDKIRQQIYLGALLHDIGKFYQRYDANSASKSELLDDAIKKLESVYCLIIITTLHINTFYGLLSF